MQSRKGKNSSNYWKTRWVPKIKTKMRIRIWASSEILTETFSEWKLQEYYLRGGGVSLLQSFAWMVLPLICVSMPGWIPKNENTKGDARTIMALVEALLEKLSPNILQGSALNLPGEPKWQWGSPGFDSQRGWFVGQVLEPLHLSSPLHPQTCSVLASARKVR